MITYFFVYAPSKFRVGGEHPLKRLESRLGYQSAGSVIEPGQEKVVDRGIYGIWSDGSNVLPEVAVLTGQLTVDYDQVDIEGGGKDSWPSIVGTTESSLIATNDEQRQRITSQFPSLTDSDLQVFLTRGV